MRKTKKGIINSCISLIIICAIVFSTIGIIPVAGASNILADTGEMIGNAHIWKFESAVDVDLASLKFTYNEGGYTPEISISSSKDEDANWLPVECKDRGNIWGWRYYSYYGSEDYLPKGTIYVKILNTERINNWGDHAVIPTDFTCDYNEYVALSDGEISFVSSEGIGNVFYLMKPSKEVDLASLKITCNIMDTNYGWTPDIAISTSRDANAEWIKLDCAKSNPYGWRYYTYSGKKESIRAGRIYIKLLASGSSIPDTISQASYTYQEYKPLEDKKIQAIRQLSDGSTLFRICPKTPVDLSTLKITYNEGGWTPKISISNSITGTYEELDVDASNEYGWRYYTYSGSKEYLKVGTYYLKVYIADKINQYTDFSVNPTDFYYDYSTYDIAPIAFNNGSLTLSGSTQESLSFSWPSAVSAYCEDEDISYRLYLSTSQIDTADLPNATWEGNDLSCTVDGLPPEMEFYAVIEAMDTSSNTVFLSLADIAKTKEYVFVPEEETLVILGDGKEDEAYIMNANSEPRHLYFGQSLMREVRSTKPLTYKISYAANYDKSNIHFYIDGDTTITAKISSDNENWIPMYVERDAGGWGRSYFSLPQDADLDKITGRTLYIKFEYKGPKKSDYHPEFDAFFITCVLYYTLTEPPKVENSVAVPQGTTPKELVIFSGIDSEGVRSDEQYLLSNTGTVGNYWSPESSPNCVFVDPLQSIVYKVQIPTNTDMSKLYIQDWGSVTGKISVSTGDREKWYTLEKTAGEDWVNRGTWKFKGEYPFVADDGYIYIRINGDGGTLVYTDLWLYYHTHGQEPVNNTGKTNLSFTTSTLDEDGRIIGDIPQTDGEGRRNLGKGQNCIYYFNLPNSVEDFSFDLKDGVNTKVYFSRDNATWGSADDVDGLLGDNDEKVLYVKVAGILNGASWSGFDIEYSYDPNEVNIYIENEEDEEDDEYFWEDEEVEEGASSNNNQSTQLILQEFSDYGVLGGQRIELVYDDLIDFDDSITDGETSEESEKVENTVRRKKNVVRKKKNSNAATEEYVNFVPYIIAVAAVVLLAGGALTIFLVRKKKRKINTTNI